MNRVGMLIFNLNHTKILLQVKQEKLSGNKREDSGFLGADVIRSEYRLAPPPSPLLHQREILSESTVSYLHLFFPWRPCGLWLGFKRRGRDGNNVFFFKPTTYTFSFIVHTIDTQNTVKTVNKTNYYNLNFLVLNVQGVSCDVLPHSSDSPSSHISLHHQRPLRPSDAVPGEASTRASEGRTVPAASTTGVRALSWWEGGTSEGATCTTTASASSERRQHQSLILLVLAIVVLVVKKVLLG